MSSIASPRRTDAPRSLADWLPAWTPTAVAAALLSALMISFSPFATIDADAVLEGGNIVNQLGYGSLGAISLIAMATYASPRVLSALFGPSMILVLVLMIFSVLNAAHPPSAARAASFTFIGILSVATILSIPRSPDSFSRVLLIAGLAVVGISYVGLVLYPTIAIHTTASNEPEHAGLWRGVFTHKNIAGPIMACFSFCGLYLMRRGSLWGGGLLFLLSMNFMLHTGSKTTAGLVPVAMIVVALPGIFGVRIVTALLFWAAIIGTALGTLGIVFIEPLKHLAAEYFPGMTFTGRVTLWEFAGDMLMKRPWTGYGYESFWMSPLMETIYQPFDREWDIRFMVHGHNGYLDIAVIMGIPTLIVAVWAFLVSPVIDYIRVPMLKENVLLGDLFMMILLFTSLNAFLESFFFRRADPVWLFFVMSVIGLRLVARFPMRPAGGTARMPTPAAAPIRRA
ncbi:MAG: O-antigen ligase family protein [Rhizobiaceae bacterium]|nr:O-antigen ligase family protein [Rhizobiaceae bacterium]